MLIRTLELWLGRCGSFVIAVKHGRALENAAAVFAFGSLHKAAVRKEGDPAVNVAEWVEFVRTGRYHNEAMF